MVKDQIIGIIKNALAKADLHTDNPTVTAPADESFGDYTTTVALQLGKQLKKDPFYVAESIAQNIKIADPIEHVKIIRPGFINISLSKKFLLKNINDVLKENDNYGKTSINKNKNVIVEYSSPNIAKPFTIGHLRSTIIGQAVANLLGATGWNVFRDNHVGDWGTQFGKQIYAVQKWGDIEKIENAENPVKELVVLYVKFHEEAEKNPELEDEARAIFKKLENGDKEIRKMWEQCIDWSWKEFNKIYEKLNVSFTENNGRGYGESYFENKMQPIIEELKEKKLLKESKGAYLVFFPGDKYPPLMILKQDGATLYSTRDLATDKFRLTNERYGKDVKIINEVGAEQSLYFQQLYEAEKMLGWVTERQRLHIKHGLYRFKDTKMSTRKGNTIWLEDVLQEAIKRANDLGVANDEQSESSKKHDLNEAEKQKIAIHVGIGAIKWNDLKRSPHLDVVFDWDEILNMQGNSGPYIQYTYVRCKSVLKKADGKITENIDASLNSDELSIIRHLIKFPETVYNASESYSPHYVATYLFDLAQKYNLFYQKNPILKAEEEVQNTRLLITKATAQVIKNGLDLLGIQVVEKM